MYTPEVLVSGKIAGKIIQYCRAIYRCDTILVLSNEKTVTEPAKFCIRRECVRHHNRRQGQNGIFRDKSSAPGSAMLPVMRGYHIRIIVHRRTEISQSHPPVVDTFLPKSIFERLPSHTSKPTSRKNATFNPAHKDYRFGPIRVDWIDFESMSAYASKTNESVRGACYRW